MKKLLTILIVAILCISLCACSGEKKAFEASKAAYNNINIAYEISEQFAADIYEAWRAGIFDDDEITARGATYLASQLSLSEDEIKNGVAYVFLNIAGGYDWDEAPQESINIIKEEHALIFALMDDDLFSFCVEVVKAAYIVNGDVDEAQVALDAAKVQMKEMSEKYSDYEHYPNLKGYYTTTSSLFDFCQHPSGSFEQVKTTINDYKNKARDYKSDLDYIFEE